MHVAACVGVQNAWGLACAGQGKSSAPRALDSLCTVCVHAHTHTHIRTRTYENAHSGAQRKPRSAWPRWKRRRPVQRRPRTHGPRCGGGLWLTPPGTQAAPHAQHSARQCRGAAQLPVPLRLVWHPSAASKHPTGSSSPSCPSGSALLDCSVTRANIPVPWSVPCALCATQPCQASQAMAPCAPPPCTLCLCSGGLRLGFSSRKVQG